MQIRFIGELSHLANERSITVNDQKFINVKDLIIFLCDKYPKLRPLISDDEKIFCNVLICIDGKVAGINDPVDDNSQIIITTPMGGG